MRSPKGLARQVSLVISSVALLTVLLTYLGFYLFYSLYQRFFPEKMLEESGLLPSAPEMMVLAGVCLMALSIAVAVSLRLTKRVVAPLNCVAQAARSIAEGDLKARAQVGDRPADEAELLVTDFHGMAARLEQIVQDIVVWNAQIAHELRTPLTISRGPSRA